LHPLLRFVLASILSVLANIIVPMLCFLLLGSHPLLADCIYRWLTSAVLLGGFVVFTRLLDQWEGNVWEYLALPWRRSAVGQLLAGVAISAVLITIAVAAIGLFGSLTLSFDFSGRAVRHAVLVILLLIGGALLEELMFRGYPFQRLVEAIRPVWAILVLSVFFGAVHLQNPHAGGLVSWGFFNTILVGVLFAYAYLRTGMLWLPIGMHFGWNFFLGTVYGLPVSGLRDFSVIVRSTAAGSKLLTGGSYGIESSLTGTVVLLVGFLLVAWAPTPDLESARLPQHTLLPGI
jgi:membrane protease YdiL (CAAX protease family)